MKEPKKFLTFEKLDDYYKSKILKCMGFPNNWKELLLI